LYRAKLAPPIADRARTQNCRAAILAANQKEPAAKIAAYNLQATRLRLQKQSFAARTRAGNESMRPHFELREKK